MEVQIAKFARLVNGKDGRIRRIKCNFANEH